MLFSSTEFLFLFLPVTVAVYLLLHKITWAKNLWLLCASLVFYAWGAGNFVFVLLGSVCISYVCGLLTDRFRRRDQKGAARAAAAAGTVCSLGLLFVYKYLTFTLDSVKTWFSLDFAVPEIVLPIGISFFTFQSVSYLIDVYRGNAKVQKNPLNLALYISLFPQLIAGPIVRYETVAEQILHRKETVQGFSAGVCRFLCGLYKKVLLSNQLGLIAEKAFSMNTEGTLTAPMAWLGAAAYMLHIYHDFSGYSDMAIGLGQMFGFSFPENFNYPYISTSVSEFWRRWHMTLGGWFRDYVYIPLGGSRVKSRLRLVCNLAVVWILTGAWHGASWNFFFWGVWFFLLLTAEKLFFGDIVRAGAEKPCYLSVLGWIYTTLAVLFGWVLFNAGTLSGTLSYLRAMFTWETGGDTTALLFLTQKAVWIAAAVLFSFPVVPFLRGKLDALRGRSGWKTIPVLCDILYPCVMGVLFLAVTAFLLKSDYNPFIYFNF